MKPKRVMWLTQVRIRIELYWQATNRVLALRSVPAWMSVREPSRFAPAGYTSRYLLSLPTHDLGERNVRCQRCGALHFLGEKVKPSSKREPRFMTCCKDGLVKLDPICEPPQPFRRLWTSEDSDCKKLGAVPGNTIVLLHLLLLSSHQMIASSDREFVEDCGALQLSGRFIINLELSPDLDKYLNTPSCIF